MEARLQKWGNSIGVRIPSNILKSLNLKANDLVDMKDDDDKIIITIKKNKKISLSERFKDYNGEMVCEPYDYGKSVGKEIW